MVGPAGTRPTQSELCGRRIRYGRTAMPTAPYPPARHVLRDLDVEMESRRDGSASAWMPVVPELVSPWGGPMAGVLATLVDMVAGGVSVRAAAPDWIATSDLSLSLTRPAAGPQVEARAHVIRKGRTTLIVGVELLDAPGEGRPGSGPPVGVAMVSFSILPRRETTLVIDPEAMSRTRFGGGGGRLDRHILEAIGIEVVDGRGGRLSLPLADYVRNSFGAVQGGIMGLVGEAAGAMAVAGALGVEAAATVDLHVAYLALGKVGPIVATASVRACDDVRGDATVHLVDAGAEGRLTTVVHVGALAGRSEAP
jgi:uncharacterized protein (TIGR00369 family)